MLVPLLKLGGDDIHMAELLPPLVRVLSDVPIVYNTAAQGTCVLVDNDIDNCPIRYFGIGI